ncbi:MAG: hypothetical protein ACRCTJ_05390 [Brevinema sp.]
MMKNYTFLFSLFFVLFILSQESFAQSLDQQLRQAVSDGVIPTNFSTNTSQNFANINVQGRFFDQAPLGISSLLSVPELVEEVKIGQVTTYFPQGYGREQLHYGIWNAIPFVVFNNVTLEVRFGLIFEHRNIGFVPDDWISTTLSAIGLPSIDFLIPATKTFLNYANGTSQWRSTVLLTTDQISNLKAYGETSAFPNANNPYQDTFNVTHRLIDSSTKPYLLGVRNKNYIKILLQIYDSIINNPLVKTFQEQDKFPKNGFFDEILANTNTTPPPAPPLTPVPTSEPEVPAYEDEIVESVVTEEIITEIEEEGGEDEYYEEDAYAE